MNRKEQITAETLLPIVRTILGDQSATISGFGAELLNGSWEAPTRTVARIFGTAEVADGVKEWSVILKVPPPIPENYGDVQREVQLYEGSFIGSLPGSFRVPTCYCITRSEDDEPWIWLEVIQGHTLGDTPLAGVSEAVRAFGEAQALQMSTGTPPLPDLEGGDASLDDWIKDSAGWVRGWVAKAQNDAQIHDALGGDHTVGRIRAAVEKSDHLAGWLAKVPRGLCHGDFQRQNIMWDEQNQCWVLIDWAFGGSAVLGFDVSNLIAACGSGHTSRLGTHKEVADALTGAYVDGLCVGGQEQHRERARVATLTIRGLTGTFGTAHFIGTVLTEPDHWMHRAYARPVDEIVLILQTDLVACLDTLDEADGALTQPPDK